MKEDFKKQTETDHVMRFRENFAGFPEGEVVPGESPDFTVDVTGARIGIEIVGLFRNELDSEGLPRRARERLQDKTLWEAMRLYKAKKTLPSVQVSVMWSFHEPITKARVGTVASSLAELVVANLPGPGDLVRLGHPHRAWKFLPKEVDHIFVSQPTNLPESAWGVVSGGRCPDSYLRRPSGGRGQKGGQAGSLSEKLLGDMAPDRFRRASAIQQL